MEPTAGEEEDQPPGSEQEGEEGEGVGEVEEVQALLVRVCQYLQEGEEVHVHTS